MTQTAMTMTEQRKAMREQVRKTVAQALAGKGYVVADLWSRDMAEVTKDGTVLGRLYFGSVDLHTLTGKVSGTVDFTPADRGNYQRRRGGVGAYPVSTEGTINVSGLAARLERTVGRLAVIAAERAADDLRDRQDDGLLNLLTGGPSNPVEGVEVSVFDGKVDVRLTDMTPAQAKAVLAVFGVGR